MAQCRNLPFTQRTMRCTADTKATRSRLVAQSYEVEADNEYVIRGNSAIMKCEVPSFVSDFVLVENWQDSKGHTYLLGENYVVQQFYNSRVIDEYVLKGNTGILKCLVPSFVSDFVQIIAWVADDGTTYDFETSKYFNSVVKQFYETRVTDEFVLKGNTGILKCIVPSFVTDFVQVEAWVADDDSATYLYNPKEKSNKMGTLRSGTIIVVVMACTVSLSTSV
ncbi:hypothetical protein D910_06210 [Dendroctonus ponderosae]|uniref:Ig-like domain-containing protein n=1 Tax=Dendroctonus ponderosae TaxID=77166 RepID=U4U938_DENPD|nr:hypothetical protein D910_06210 [Dendroctonus ponderosae]